MRERILDPIDLDSVYEEAIGNYLSEHFRREVYRPLFLLVSGNVDKNKIQNSMNDLLNAIKLGRVNFYRGKFKGKFNAKISKELKKLGAVWSNREGGHFKLRSAKLPREIRHAISASEAAWMKTNEKLVREFQSLMGKDIASGIDLENIVSKAVRKVNGDFEESLKGIRVAPKLTDKNVKDIAKNYTENMKYHIQTFSESEIVKLRRRVQKNVFAGNRYEKLAEEIKRSYGVSKSKAMFLARQETNLLVAKFKESRYNEVGCDEYIWQTVVGSPASPVREGHKKLNGTKQRFSSPPIVNERGERKNPGEDYNCRCRAKPIIKF